MFKSICISILLTGTAFYSFCQDLEKLNKKELRVFLNQKIIVIDSLINKIDSQYILRIYRLGLPFYKYILFEFDHLDNIFHIVHHNMNSICQELI